MHLHNPSFNFSRENSTIASGEVNTILFITVAFCSALNIPFESEQKQKNSDYKITSSLARKTKIQLNSR